MQRIEALRAIYPELQREKLVVVTIMGAVSVELQEIGHRPNFFYLQHAMGLASSLGLGVALSRPEVTVVVLDGDGSILMNLGALTTLARYRPANLVHLVFDNESLVSVGGFPTATSTGTNIAAIAAAAGVPRTTTVTELEPFREAFADALAAEQLTTLVAKVEEVVPSGFVTDLNLLENRFQFQRHLDPPFPNHSTMHGAGKLGLASLCNLSQLPATGAVVIAAPLKLVDGSGSPLRVLALTPA